MVYDSDKKHICDKRPGIRKMPMARHHCPQVACSQTHDVVVFISSGLLRFSCSKTEFKKAVFKLVQESRPRSALTCLPDHLDLQLPGHHPPRTCTCHPRTLRTPLLLLGVQANCFGSVHGRLKQKQKTTLLQTLTAIPGSAWSAREAHRSLTHRSSRQEHEKQALRMS